MSDKQALPARDVQPDDSHIEAAWRYRFEEFATVRDDDAGIAGWSPSGLESRMRRFIGLWVRGKPGERWLDAGCGAGSYSRLLLERGVEVVGIDYSLPTILKARARTVRKGTYAVADVRRLPFRLGSFDGVLCFGVMQALGDTAPALQELADQSAASGQVWVDALNRWCFVYLWDTVKRKIAGRPRHLRYDSPWKIKRGLVECGLVNVKFHWMPILPARWQRFQPALEGRAAQWFFRSVPLSGLLFCHAFIVCGQKPARPAIGDGLPPG
jgi:SAM-dependent methyltransferase